MADVQRYKKQIKELKQENKELKDLIAEYSGVLNEVFEMLDYETVEIMGNIPPKEAMKKLQGITSGNAIIDYRFVQD